jgi:hypothetical protein
MYPEARRFKGRNDSNIAADSYALYSAAPHSKTQRTNNVCRQGRFSSQAINQTGRGRL